MKLTVWIDFGYDGGWAPTEFEGPDAKDHASEHLAKHCEKNSHEPFRVTQDLNVKVIKAVYEIEE